jgi:hypothetical protein
MRKEIKLVFFATDRTYKVITVRNSTDYNPGEILSKAEVDDLCDHTNWEVVILSNRKS